jgi:molybdate transport system substrate-binding protein
MILAGLMTASVRAGDVFVAAAASLTEVMKAVEPLYSREHPGSKLTFVFGSTGMLRTQLLKGAPCAVFIGADRWFGGAATNVEEVVVADSVRLVAANTLVAVAGAGASPQGGTLAAWLEGARKIGIGNPASVPAGRYTKKLLESEKLWEVSSAKFVQGSNVREVLLWLRQGVADVGFVYGSDLVAAKDAGLTTLAEYVSPGGTVIELAGGVANNAKNPAEAQAFLDYLKTPEAVAVFRGLGFRVAE